MKKHTNDKSLLALYTQSNKKMSPKYLLTSASEKVASANSSQSNTLPTLKDKLNLSKLIIQEGIAEHRVEHTAIAWTGGKDSTLILWLTKQVCKENSWDMPHCIFINEGHVFEEIKSFVKQISKDWNLEVTEVHNNDVSEKTNDIGDMVRVKDLDKRNQQEIKRVGFKGEEFPFEPESMIGNHLMKTVAMNRYLEITDFSAIVTGIRWDEQEARADETYFSARGDKYTPEHTRIHPILHLTERDVWDATLENDVPYCSLYAEGFRSLGAKGTTEKADDKPAWEQDFQKVSERAGRQQDKEQIMKRLRELGYM